MLFVTYNTHSFERQVYRLLSSLLIMASSSRYLHVPRRRLSSRQIRKAFRATGGQADSPNNTNKSPDIVETVEHAKSRLLVN